MDVRALAASCPLSFLLLLVSSCYFCFLSLFIVFVSHILRSFFIAQMYKLWQDRTAASHGLASLYQRQSAALSLSICQLATPALILFLRTGRRPVFWHVGCNCRRVVISTVFSGRSSAVVRGMSFAHTRVLSPFFVEAQRFLFAAPPGFRPESAIFII